MSKKKQRKKMREAQILEQRQLERDFKTYQTVADLAGVPRNLQYKNPTQYLTGKTDRLERGKKATPGAIAREQARFEIKNGKIVTWTDREVRSRYLAWRRKHPGEDKAIFYEGEKWREVDQEAEILYDRLRKERGLLQLDENGNIVRDERGRAIIIADAQTYRVAMGDITAIISQQIYGS